jgi:hypothetical protein
MTAQPEPQPEASQSADLEAKAERLERATDDAIAACGGDLRATVKSLIVAVEFLEAEIERQVSHGFLRGVKHGRFNTHTG